VLFGSPSKKIGIDTHHVEFKGRKKERKERDRK
jgi:hypothetical protein